MPVFKRPTEASTLQSLADHRKETDKQPPPPILAHYRPWIERALRPETNLFDPIRRPRRGDWLSEHTETGQSLKTFVRGLHAAPHGPFRSIALVPLGDISDVPLEDLAYFLRAFFGLQTVTLPHVTPEELRASVTNREGSDRNRRQFLTKDIHTLASRLVTRSREYSRVSVVTVCVTMDDLYPEDSWNYVFGEADIVNAVGVFSFCRYDPRFSDPAAVIDPARMLQRACKIMAHEIGHMFGLRHCIHFTCLMNGSNHLEELDANGFLLCPVCLFKLLDGFRWNLSTRYNSLLQCAYQLGCFPESVCEQLGRLAESVAAFEAAAGSPPGAVDWSEALLIPPASRRTVAGPPRRTVARQPPTPTTAHGPASERRLMASR